MCDLVIMLQVFKSSVSQCLVDQGIASAKSVVPLRKHRAASRRYGERHQRCPALNHMCNQSKLTARRQVR